MKPREHGRGAYADTPMRFVSIKKMKEALAQFFDKHLQGTEGAPNPATRPLVKSLMKVLSFLMGRRRKVVPDRLVAVTAVTKTHESDKPPATR